MRILLVEDEPQAALAVAKGLREHGYAVDTAGDGKDALYQAAISDYGAIVLDVALPRIDGLTVCRRLRGEGNRVPVLMLTARDSVDARIEGLDSGADDYLTKPFDLGELLARVRALVRRGHRPIAPAILQIGSIALDTGARRATRQGRMLPLTGREFALLEFLAQNAGTVVGRGLIAEHVWDSSYESRSNVIDVCIQRLRRKIDDAGKPSLIETRRGEGYMLAELPVALVDPPLPGGQ